MRRFAFSTALFLVIACTATSNAGAAGDGMIVKRSPHPVGVTLDKLESVLKQNGIRVFARIDHAAGAERVGLELPATQLLIFGNPKLGTPLMQAGPTVALDLPMKALAYVDADGAVRLVYNDPAYLAERHGITGQDALIDKMTRALDKLTDAATQSQ
ncbi:DUF302 domain-containing protein [Rhodovibrio salinarum]|uniref:DUF302 domain-containing protein n=1 Tax=Rhodovibrio salinarum TaxID=1087 RepID=A0A934QHV2_9PROT|nr:DUF302 domain-containing protein [Rhodovibrio salinarum]MBK1697266.1 DUF302 domain-containing protein [Rhodovibrio salinarum]